MATLERMAIDYHALTLFCVDYCDKLSNLFDDICAINQTAREIQGRGRSAEKQLLAFCKKDDHLFPE